jgi:hypothetical protein
MIDMTRRQAASLKIMGPPAPEAETQCRQQFRGSRQKYSDLFDFAPVGYLSLDENGLVVEANLTIATLLVQNEGGCSTGPFKSML